MLFRSAKNKTTGKSNIGYFPVRYSLEVMFRSSQLVALSYHYASILTRYKAGQFPGLSALGRAMRYDRIAGGGPALPFCCVLLRCQWAHAVGGLLTRWRQVVCACALAGVFGPFNHVMVL